MKATLGSLPAVAVLLLASPLGAQEQPQFVWEGVVDGLSVVQVRGNRVQVDDRQGLPVQRQRYRFFERLPDSRQNVRVEVREGRGRVRIIQQPRLENNYVLEVAIEDRQGGASFYSLEFFWDTGRGGFFKPLNPRVSTNLGGNRLVWSGRVDGEAVVECRGNRCRAETISGGPVTRERVSFSRALPGRDVTVSLDDFEGRGEVVLLQQPRRENRYAARVLIRDPKGGAADYSFTLSWAPGSRGGEPIARRAMVWYGRVDGRVRVTVQGRRARAQVLSGGPLRGERAEFLRELPRRENHAATVHRVDGRGRVDIVEFPGRLNGYRLVFEIDDRSGGADDYEVEVSW